MEVDDEIFKNLLLGPPYHSVSQNTMTSKNVSFCLVSGLCFIGRSFLSSFVNETELEGPQVRAFSSY